MNRFDQSIEKFSCRRKTVRWPLLLFYNMLDAAALNAYMIMEKCEYKSSRKTFLTLQLATPVIHARLSRKRTRSSVHDAVLKIGNFIKGCNWRKFTNCYTNESTKMIRNMQGELSKVMPFVPKFGLPATFCSFENFQMPSLCK